MVESSYDPPPKEKTEHVNFEMFVQNFDLNIQKLIIKDIITI